MTNIGRIGAGLLVTLFALSLTACAGLNKEQKPEGTTSVGEQVSQAGQATGEAAEAVGEKTKQEARNAAQATSKGAEQAEKSIETGIGGGPPKSDTLDNLNKVDRETKRWQPLVDKYGDKLKPETKLRFKQVQQQSKELRKMYDQMKQKTNLGVVDLDQNYESQSDEIEDAWDNVQNSLRDQLGLYPKDMNNQQNNQNNPSNQ